LKILILNNYLKKLYNNKLFKDSFVYIIADVINKGIPFLLLPILTYYLTPDDYGVLATFNSLIAILGTFIGLSIQGVVTVNFYKLNKRNFAQYIGNIIIILIFSFLIVSIILYLFRGYFENLIQIPYKWIVVASLLVVAIFIVTINLTLWIAEQQPKKYGIYQILETSLKFGLSLFFVIILSMRWEGRVLGMFIGGFISAIISLYLLYRRKFLDFTYNFDYIKDALKFGIPLIPHQLSFWLRSGAVIFLLVYLVGKKETGLYNVGAQLVVPLAVLNDAFNKAWAPFLYKKLSNNPSMQDKKKLVNFTYLYFFSILVLSLLLIFISPYIIELILNKKFYNSYIFIKFLAIATAFRGMYLMVVNYIYYEKRTKILAYITFGTSLFNVLFAYWLIKKIGAIGAAQAYMYAQALSFILVWFYSNKVYKMPWKIF